MRRQVALLLALVLSAWASAAWAEGPDPDGVSIGISEGTDVITLGAGAFDINDDFTSGEFRLEYRFVQRPLWLTPIVGILANTDGGIFGYGGFGLDLAVGEHFVLTPQATMGGYRQGDSKDLGGVFQFRTGVEFAYRFADRTRIGLAFHHISNAGLHEKNPGTESLLLTLSLPLLSNR